MRQQSALHNLIRMWHPLIHLGRSAQASLMFSKAHGHSFPDDCQIQRLEQGSGVSVGGEDGATLVGLVDVLLIIFVITVLHHE